MSRSSIDGFVHVFGCRAALRDLVRGGGLLNGPISSSSTAGCESLLSTFNRSFLLVEASLPIVARLSSLDGWISLAELSFRFEELDTFFGDDGVALEGSSKLW